MITIEYIIRGSYTPFLVILRDTDTELLVNSKVVHEPDTLQQFINVPFGNYQIEVYDGASGLNIVVPSNTTQPTTQATTLPTTVQTTAAIFD